MTAVRISRDVLDQARRFFEECGSHGHEGTAMIANSTANGSCRLIIPDQRAGVAPTCWVEVTQAGKLQLASALGVDDRYIARIHSHPMDAFHSRTDDVNPAITFEGAVSIVAPYFGLGLRHGLDACAVFVRRAGHWIELPPGSMRNQTVEITT